MHILETVIVGVAVAIITTRLEPSKGEKMMRAHLLVAIVAPLLTTLGAAPSLAQQVAPTCTQDTRECMIQAATAYLDSIVNHEASTVPFAPDVKRTELRSHHGHG